MKRVPIVPTLIVLLAVAYMIHLGSWQLDRLKQKEAMLARYQAAGSATDEVDWPLEARNEIDPPRPEDLMYRRARLDCRRVVDMTTVSGQNSRGEPGMAHVAICRLADAHPVRVVLGWSRNPASPVWSGGVVTGRIAPGPRLVADPPLAGLQPNAKPDPADIPNNHLAYAVQWFLFAGVALVIYALALRKRMRAD
ncbi:threonine synthase [Novosphingobium fuchskuhlense]|uniref:SURF1-like protein n=1 Tax=Novosphingobium fuchskuhlense TaxID=1117702 RepID=A0A117UXZ2_9SPHN|nr:SURF1 family protein [Novosphingobium fuchskuhlense]KUR72908.1 threonine synthase [Novosphingobium fuchskuhlense]